MRTVVLAVLLCAVVTPGFSQGMNGDPEAKALLARFQAMKSPGDTLADDFNAARERRIAGPITLGPGREGQGQAAVYPDKREEAVYLYYGGVIPRCGHLGLDFLLPAQWPKDWNFMTLFSAGTAGNTKFMLRIHSDLRPWVQVLTKRENVTLTGDPVQPGVWHHLDWWYGPDGAVLVVDEVIQDYSTDPCVAYAVEGGEAFYLGDQPWWDDAGHKGIFYALDNFVGSLDNLRLQRLQ